MLFLSVSAQRVEFLLAALFFFLLSDALERLGRAGAAGIAGGMVVFAGAFEVDLDAAAFFVGAAEVQRSARMSLRRSGFEPADRRGRVALALGAVAVEQAEVELRGRVAFVSRGLEPALGHVERARHFAAFGVESAQRVLSGRVALDG